jgi:sugar lactone lactonase YvrE
MPSPSTHDHPVTTPACGTPEAITPAGALLGEGLCWSVQQQALYWVDILGRRLMRLRWPSREQAQWHFDQTISTVAERSNGAGLIVALRHHVALFEPDSGSLQVLHEAQPHVAGNRFNDGKCDAQGRFWVGSMDMACQAQTGSLHCVTSAGPDRASTMACAWDCRFPVINGPAWSMNGRSMWLNDTARNFIHRCDVDPDSGAVSNPRVWMRFAKGDGYPDGMTVDGEGRLWIAHWGGGCVTCHANDDGRELARIALPTTNITNVAFGGPDMRTLFISSAATELSDEQRALQPHAGAVFAVTTDAVGLPAHRFAG